MKFKVYDLVLESKKYRIYEPIKVPKQLRFVYPPDKTANILANAEGYSLLEDLFKIASVDLKDNNLILIKDCSKEVEGFHKWFPTADFHLNLMIYNYQFTQISTKKMKRLLEMMKYKKAQHIDIAVPDITYRDIWHWELKNTLNVDKRSKFISISSNSTGFEFLADIASRYTDMVDDEEENGAHSHLRIMTGDEDLLDYLYFFEAD